MTLLAIFQWLQSTEVATALRESSWVYPIVMATHLTGMALFGGMILITRHAPAGPGDARI